MDYVFGIALLRIRTAAGVSQVKLAERAGVTQQMVSLYESGKLEPSWRTACRIADALGAKLDSFRSEK